MRNLVLFLLIILAAISCKKDEIQSVTPKLKNCGAEYLLLFEDIEQLISGNPFIIDPRDTTGAFYSYTYADDKMTRSSGGFVSVPSGSNFSTQLFSKDVYDSIYNKGNLIYIYKKTKYENTIVENTFNPTIYTLDPHKRLSTIFKRDYYRPDGYSFTYTYSDNLITEINSKGQISRKFFFENNNLVKVLTEYYDIQGVIGMEKEIVFKDFDDNPNSFKDMYYVKGAFYRAFSANNYKSYSISKYFVLADGTSTPIGTYNSYAWPIKYNADGYPMFGDYV